MNAKLKYVTVIGFLVNALSFTNTIFQISRSRKFSIDMAVMGRNLEVEVNGNKIYYDYMKSDKPSPDSFPILYLPGLFHNKNEAKTVSIQSYCKKNAYDFLCADYYGVGKTSDKFAEATLSRWVDDTIAVMENVLKSKKVLLVGFGVGTWVSFVIAARRPDLVKGIVAMATDIDFTEELIWKKLSDDIKNKIMTEGSANIPWGNSGNIYPISKALIEDGRQHLILKDRKPNTYPVRCPVRLMHAIDDDEVPYVYALKIVNAITSLDANVVLLKRSTHSMDNEADIHTMRFLIEEVMTDARLRVFDLRSPASG